MNKIFAFSISALLVLSLFACKKNNSNSSGVNNLGISNNQNTQPPVVALPVGDVPSEFSKKTIVEECTGEWCHACPEGGEYLHEIVVAHPDKAYPIAVHSGDSYEATEAQQLLGIMGNPGSYPTAIVDRQIDGWESAVSQRLQLVAPIGLAMVAKTNNDKLNLTVYLGRKDSWPAGTKLSVFLIEDDLDASNQTDAPPGYRHEHVFRGAITDVAGDDYITKPGSKHASVVFENIDIAGKYLNKDNVRIVAFVHTAGVALAGADVLNAQMCGLNEVKKWD